MKTGPLKIIRLMEPALCLTCRFASIASVETKDNHNRRILHCQRLDCDNWQEEVEDRPISMTIEE